MGLTKTQSGGLEDQSVTLAKIEHGTSSNDGKFLRANNGADPTFETVTSFSDDKIVNDISALALKVNALQNATRYNTNSTSVDTYQDSNGVASFTTCGRDGTGEYVSSIFDAITTYDFNTAGTHGQPEILGLQTQQNYRRSAYWTNDQVRSFNGQASGGPTYVYPLTAVNFAFDLSGDFTHVVWYKTATNGATSDGQYQTFNAVISPLTTITTGKNPTLSGSSIFDITSTTQATLQAYGGGYGYGDIYGNGGANTTAPLSNSFSSAAYTHLDIDNMNKAAEGGTTAINRSYTAVASSDGYLLSGYLSSNSANYRGLKYVYTYSTNTLVLGAMADENGTFSDDLKQTITNMPTTGRVFLYAGGFGHSDTNAYFSLRNNIGINSTGEFRTPSANATGNYISNAVTASASTTSMGVVITYKDHAGTATLNTDLKVSLSADNGSNFTQVTLVAQPDFATGVKMAIANDVTVTAGTQLKYKVEFANQASGSKETRVTGVSMQF